MGILSGLEGFGLGGLSNIDIFGTDKKEEKKEDKKEKVETAPVMTESDFIFAKGYKCPCCDQEFKTKTVKIGKAKLIDTDLDLRPKYEIIDSLKYDVILCPVCGYAALSRFFPYLTGPQAKLIKANISQNFKNAEMEADTYSYDVAIEHYKLALANAIVKRARASEKAYICLKLGWVIRGKGENLPGDDPDHEAKLKECNDEENELLRNALDGFLAARQAETFPMCGMDESTVDYLIAVLSARFGQLDVAAKLVQAIITSPVANKRMKDKARNLKDHIVAQIKGSKK